MAAAGVRFWMMDEGEMRRYADEYPGRVNEQDSAGYPLLASAVAHNKSMDLISWLVDEEGADIEGRDQRGHTALFYAKAVDIMSFLLERGADPTVRDNNGWTALMYHSRMQQVDFVERLLQDPRGVAGIDVQVTGDYKRGSSALHFAFLNSGSTNNRARIIDLLLLNGANPLLRDAQRHTPLDLARQRYPKDYTTIPLLERAMAEPQRTFLLSKARQQVDAFHSLNQVAKDTAGGVEEKRKACMAKAPIYLKERVAAGDALPVVELPKKKKGKKEQQQPLEAVDEKEQLGAVLAYVLREQQQEEQEQEEEGVGEGEKTKEEEQEQGAGMSADVFVELLEMMAPKWDPIRGGAVAAGGGAGGGGGGGGEGGH